MAAMLVACTKPTSTPSPSGLDAQQESDAPALPDGAAEVTDAAVDAPPQVDAPLSDAIDAALACPGAPGCPCQENAGCDNALCIEIDGAKQCAHGCVDTCPEGLACAQVTSGGGDIVSICVPRFGRLCDPCTGSADCEALGLSGSACVDQGAAGRFCGASCATATDCPSGYGCQAVTSVEGQKVQQCVRLPDEPGAAFGTCPCSAAAKLSALSTPCQVIHKDAEGKPIGKCAGFRTCTADGLSACLAPDAAVEVCDGKDNDCDGDTDEATCDDAEVCTQDKCLGAAGCQATPVVDGLACDADGNVCTVGDACKAGTCVAGQLKACDDGNPCTADACDLMVGCTTTANDGIACDDDNPCTTGDVCSQGACASGKPKTCDSGMPCVAGTCSLVTGKCDYKNKKAGAACDDGDACTGPDGCVEGACEGAVLGCDDGNPCTADACDPAQGCGHTPNVAACDDGDACTVKDACVNGKCQAGGPKACDDGQPCTKDACVQGVCQHTSTTGNCDDGNACTQADTCAEGACMGAAVGCDDGNPCTTDSCAPAKGCQHAATTAPCDDGDACTTGDACDPATAACKGAASVCDDGNVCTDDKCDAGGKGCVSTGKDGAACGGGTCKGSVCVSNKAVAITAGHFHTCALLEAGTVACWGKGGLIGDGTKDDRAQATAVIGLTGVLQVTAGPYHSCAVRDDGSVWCWGMNGSGQLGDNTVADHDKPVKVKGVTTALAVACGSGFSCALEAGGAVRCWGANWNGQLGDGTTVDKLMPGAPVSQLPPVAQVEAGGSHACGVTKAGALYCWGGNQSGQIPSVPHPALKAFPVGIGAVLKVAPGSDTTCAVMTDGKVQCYGSSQSMIALPSTALAPVAPAAKIAVGKAACALKKDGTAWCWGRNSTGQAGHGFVSDSVQPGPVTVLKDMIGMAAGESHTCGLRSDGTVWCWGASSAALGNGSTEPEIHTKPVQVSGVSSATGLAIGSAHACARLTSGKVACWGRNPSGQLGDGTQVHRSAPVLVEFLEDAAAVTAGMDHTCAVEGQGLASCWGSNGALQLGATGAFSLYPIGQKPAVYGVTMASANVHRTCVAAAGKAWCWGASAMPEQVTGFPAAVLAVAPGNGHACALLANGETWCWGSNTLGEFGIGYSNSGSTGPVPAAPLQDVQALVAAGHSNCALVKGGSVWCWGAGPSGQLGGGVSVDKQVKPVAVAAVAGATAVAIGAGSACAVLGDGGVSCWGGNFYGQLGNGTTEKISAPTKVVGLTDAGAVSIGSTVACAAKKDGTVWCWGRSADGQIGNGKVWQTTATQVIGFP